MPSKTLAVAVLFSLLSPLVAGHAAIVRATGDAGGQGMALGIDTATPRDGTRRNPFQQDSTRFKGQAADTVGETLAGGDNDVEAGTTAIMGETGEALPQVTQGGEVQMTLHQVNGDGGGPYSCAINDDATAATWTDIKVTDMPPGENSRSRDTQTSEQALTAAVPANQACTGTVAGQDNVCLVRCMNDANAGPFGGVVPVQMVQAATAGNATAGAAPPAAAKAEARRSFARYVAAREKELQKLKKRSY
ncbi:1,3-beta-glucanosyltransferase gas1 [Diaporthe eres]|uniref:1,3-beta-glucanosyltransferase gas1 n=1 Tax=Diaporthe eres TaxID=83184 RepID=A0ABR1NZ31_DIAER